MALYRQATSLLLVLSLMLVPTWVQTANAQSSSVVPRNTVLKVLLNEGLSTKTTEEGDPFTATVAEDVRVDGRVLIRRGAEIQGTVTEVEEAQRLAGLSGRASLTLRFDNVDTISGERPMRATVVSVHDPANPDEDADGDIDEEGEIEAETDVTDILTKGAIGLGAGALLGAIFGNVSRGVLLGTIGGAVAILAPKGEDVELEEGSGLRIRLDRDIDLRMT